MNYTTKPAGSSASSMIVDAKRAARAAAIAQRDAIPASDRACMATVLASVDLPFVGRGNIVSAYYPIGSEMDVLPLLTHLVAEGARTALPIVEGRGKPLQFRIWAPGDSLERGVLNIPVPFASARQRVPSILLVPCWLLTMKDFALVTAPAIMTVRLQTCARQARCSPSASGLPLRKCPPSHMNAMTSRLIGWSLRTVQSGATRRSDCETSVLGRCCWTCRARCGDDRIAGLAKHLYNRFRHHKW